jgi:hypothetical protein
MTHLPVDFEKAEAGQWKIKTIVVTCTFREIGPRIIHVDCSPDTVRNSSIINLFPNFEGKFRKQWSETMYGVSMQL